MHDPAQTGRYSSDQAPPAGDSEPGPADGGAALLKKIERVAAWHTEQALALAGTRGQAHTADYLRAVLTAYQVLPERDVTAARIERHLARTVARHPRTPRC